MPTLEVVGKWKEQVAQVNEKASKSLADPEGYPNLFPNFDLGDVKKEEEEEEEERDAAAPADDGGDGDEVDARPVPPPMPEGGDDDVEALEQEIDKLKVRQRSKKRES